MPIIECFKIGVESCLRERKFGIKLRGMKIVAITKTILMNNNNHPSNKGGSDRAVQPKTNTPENQPAVEQSPNEEKIIGIGMPENKEEMEKRKEDAKKMDR